MFLESYFSVGLILLEAKNRATTIYNLVFLAVGTPTKLNEIKTNLVEPIKNFASNIGRACAGIMDLFKNYFYQNELPDMIIAYFVANASPKTEITQFSFAKKNNKDSQDSRITIDFSLKVDKYFIPENQEYREVSHTFEVYLPKTVTPNGYSVISDTGTFRHTIDVECLDSLDPESSLIGIRLYQQIHPTDDDGNKFDYIRNDPVGDVLIPISELEPNKEIHLDVMDMSFPKKKYMKVKLTWQTHEINLIGAKINESTKNDQKIQRNLVSKISEFFTFYENNVPLKKELFKIHVPRYPTTSVMLPASMFASETFSNTNDEFLKKLIRYSLLLNNMEESTYLNTIKTQFNTNTPKLEMGFKSCIKIMCESTTIFANVCDYKPDISNGQLCERFLSVFKTFMGDCEDLAHSIKCIATCIYEGNWSEKKIRFYSGHRK